MFTDLTGSTDILKGIGDDRWAHLLDAHRAAVRSALRRFGGVEVDAAGDGFFSTFVLPSEALRCAQAIRIESAEHGLSVRIGLHCGEVVRQGDGSAALRCTMRPVSPGWQGPERC
jgi:class 3 adenylate cyclase